MAPTVISGFACGKEAISCSSEKVFDCIFDRSVARLVVETVVTIHGKLKLAEIDDGTLEVIQTAGPFGNCFVHPVARFVYLLGRRKHFRAGSRKSGPQSALGLIILVCIWVNRPGIDYYAYHGIWASVELISSRKLLSIE
jgi:hypothetical protein